MVVYRQKMTNHPTWTFDWGLKSLAWDSEQVNPNPTQFSSQLNQKSILDDFGGLGEGFGSTCSQVMAGAPPTVLDLGVRPWELWFRVWELRFRGGLVFKADRLCASLNSRRESDKEEEKKKVWG